MAELIVLQRVIRIQRRVFPAPVRVAQVSA